MKKYKITYWTIATIIFLFEGVLVALTSQSQMAIDGIAHLGYPAYFGNLLAIFKVLGAIALIVPAVKGYKKEWAFAGFYIVFISAAVSNWVVDGFGAATILALVFIVLLTIAHKAYHKINA